MNSEFPKAQILLEAVAEYYGVTPGAIKGPGKTKTVAMARKEFKGRCLGELQLSLAEIAIVMERTEIDRHLRVREVIMELKEATLIAEQCQSIVRDCCTKNRIVIAGSIRRKKSHVGDIELLCIPEHDEEKGDLLHGRVSELLEQGLFKLRPDKRGRTYFGRKNKLLIHVPTGIGVDIFATDEECWPVALVVRTGGKKTNIAIATAAIRKGWEFHAYGKGFTTPQGELVCRSERDVFEMAGLPYLEPWDRE